jgi:hypothetical protein
VTFLEKVAEMFEILSWTIPQYQLHLDRCRERRDDMAPARLIELMGMLYADVLKFCQEIYCMFSRGRKGMETDFTSPRTFKGFNNMPVE